MIPAFGIENEHNKEDISYIKSTSQNTPSDIKYDYSILRLFFTVGYDLQKPLNQKWQYYLQTFVKVGPSKTINKYTNLIGQDTTVESSLTLTDIVGYLETGIGFYPNTRTYLDFSIDGFFDYDRGTYTLQSAGQDAENTYFALEAAFKGYYYISSRIRLFGDFRITYANLNGNNSLIGKYNKWDYFDYYAFYLTIDEGKIIYQNIGTYFSAGFRYSIF